MGIKIVTMVRFSKENIKQFRKMDILAIYLFGSMATGKYIHDRSDFDFGIVLKNSEKLKGNTLEIYNELYDIIIEKLPKGYLKKRFELKAHEFDIVFLQDAPIRLQFEVMSSGKVIYENDAEKRLNYEEYVMKKQCDLAYFRTIREKSILERIL